MTEDYELRSARELLERAGYLVRKPEEIDIPVVVRSYLNKDRPWEGANIRAQVMVNGRSLAIDYGVPVQEMILDPGYPLGRMMSRKLAAALEECFAKDIIPAVDREMQLRREAERA